MKTVIKVKEPDLGSSYLSDKTLSLDAKGLFAYLLALGRSCSLEELEGAAKADSHETVAAAIRELETAGYITEE